MDSSLQSTSPDPISLVAGSSPQIRTGKGTPLQPLGPNTRSSRKSITLQPSDADGNSPWRIKLTIEADTAPTQPQLNASRTTRIPVHGLHSSPAQTREIGRPNASANNAPRTRRSTPARQAQTDMAPTPERLATGYETTARRRTQRIASTPGPMVTNRQRPTDNISQAKTSQHGDALGYPKFANDEPTIGHGEVTDAPGDATTMENEEFSMISVESLSSRHGIADKNVDQSLGDVSRLSTRSRGKNDMTWSYMPSSPPILATTVTPQMAQTPQQPPKPLGAALSFPAVSTPQRASVVRSGKVLQDIVRTPEHNQRTARQERSLFAGFSSNAKRDLRESLQVGLAMANKQPQLQSSMMSPEQPSSGAPATYPKLMNSHIDHRLPTPDEDKSLSTVSSGPAVYPDLTEALTVPPSHVSVRSYDMMSWAPTGPERRSSPLARQVSIHNSQMTPPHSSPSAAPAQDVVEISSEVGEDEAEEDDDEEADEAEEVESAVDESEGVTEGDIMDLWQEEAIRSMPNESPENSRMSVACHSSQIGSRLATPKSAEKESRLNAGNTRDHVSKQNEHATYHHHPSSIAQEDEEEMEEEDEVDEEGEDEASEGEASAASQASEDISPDGDDTGLFWQRNMPNVYRRQRQDLSSFISELKPLTSEVSHGDTSASISQSAGNVSTSKSSHTATVLSSPLRKSLLKSSKIRSDGSHDIDETSKLSGSGTDMTETTVNETTLHTHRSGHTDQESTAADVRQLRSEMAAQSKHVKDPSEVGEEEVSYASEEESYEGYDESQFGQSLLESTDLHVSRSYVENLNLDSPAKIAVKFNDSSSVHPRSISRHPAQAAPHSIINVSTLSPAKKKYGSLFAEDAPLGAQDASESVTMQGQETPRAQVASAPSPNQSLFSQMTSSLWSAVTPRGVPSPKPQVILEPSESSVNTTPVAPKVPSIPDLTLRLRRKYGILEASHPFTLFHAHTLRRLYLSTVQHPDQTLIPINTSLSAQQKTLRCLPCKPNDLHIHIATSFMSLLVQQAHKQPGQWGDAGATKLKGWDSKGRHGSWFAFAGDSKEDKEARALRGEIEIEWVTQVLGDIVVKIEAGGR